MKSLIWIAVAIILAGGAWYLFSNRSAPASPAPTANEASATSGSLDTAVSPTPTASLTITYTDSGFSPSSITVPVGATVTFVNKASDEMLIASNPHPTHQSYDGTTRAAHCAASYAGPAPLDECTAAGPGGSWTFTFTKAGTWGFHNHTSPGEGGSVTVE